MNMKLKNNGSLFIRIFFGCTVLLSCSQSGQHKQEKTAGSPVSNHTAPLIELTQPALTPSGKIDTSRLKCYINTYALPYVVKIDNLYYEVKANDLPAFISSQKNELKKYRIHLLSPKNTSYKQTIDLLDILTKNDIRDFEEVVDGVLQK
jgi:hypothetical protein